MKTSQAWERFGRDDPYYGVLTQPQYQAGRLDDEARTAFFASGENFVDQSLALVHDRLDAEFTPTRALDFGCGVGRLSLALARRCDEVVGVDISPSMLAEARENATTAGIDNIDFVVADDRLQTVGGDFDLLLSFIVFQHLTPGRGERMFAAMVDKLREGGVGVLHLTYANASSTPLRRRVTTSGYERVPGLYGVRNVLKRQPFGAPQMHMTRYDMSSVLRHLQERSCHDIHVRFTEASHYRHPIYGAILYFRKLSLDTGLHS